MRECRVVLYGYGSVGKAFVDMLVEKEEFLRGEEDVEFKVFGVVTKRHGWVLSETPLDLVQLRTTEEFERSSTDLPPVADLMKQLSQSPYCVDVVIEAIPTNYETGEPALSILRSALQNGMHSVTANKGPVVHGYSELTELGRTTGKKFLFESSVMDGVPIFNLAKNCLRGASIKGFKGILNSTTNVVLSGMEKGLTFEQSLQEARDIGIVEEDASGDIDGWDAAVKVAALSTVLFRTPVSPSDVPKESIKHLTPEQVNRVASEGRRFKVICSGLPLKVALEEVPPSSPFYNISGASAAVEIYTDVLGPITVVSTNPTNSDTAYGVLSDCLEAVRC